MRFLSNFSALSAGILSLMLAEPVLAASSGLVVRNGRFPAASLSTAKGASAATLEQTARKLLSEQIPAATAAELRAARTVALSDGERVVKLRQLHQGLLVAHRGAAVTFGSDGVARLVAAHLEADLPSSVVPQRSAAEAAAIVAAATGLALDPTRAVLAIWPLPDGARLVWAVSPTPLPGLPYLPVVLVDAASGEILLRYNAVTSLNQAMMYPSNPAKSPSLAAVTLPVGAGKTTLENDLVRSLNCIDTQKAVDVGGLQIHLCELLPTAAPDANGDYVGIAPAADTEPEDEFSELSMFHHVNVAYDRFRSFAPSLKVTQNAIPTVSNLRFPQGFDTFDPDKIGDVSLPLVPFQNAFFSPGDPVFNLLFDNQVPEGAMFFGQGPVADYSYDGDVVYHEFTHAVVHVTLELSPTPHLDAYGASAAPGAMNEGLADFFSSSITGDPDVGEYAVQDFSQTLPAIRSLANPDACPSAVGGESHQDATMFSGSLWDVRKTLAPNQQLDFDAAVFKAMNSAPTGDLAYEDFAKTIVSAVGASASLGTPVGDTLTDAFTKRGLLPQCTRVLESTGEEMSGPKDLQGLWWAPGTQTNGTKASMGGWTPGVVQFHQKLETNTEKLTITFDGLELPSSGFGGMGTPFKPKLLLRFGAAPIQFVYSPLEASEDVVLVDPSKSGNQDYMATVDVPAGASEVFLMITSTGERDGAYRALKIAAEVGAPSTTTGTGGATSATSSSTGGSAGVGGGGSSNGKPDPEEVGGCGCSLPGQDGVSAGAAVGAGAIFGAMALLASRRRRRSRNLTGS